MVETFALKELCVGAFFHDLSLIQDEDAIGALNRGESMSDDKCCPSFHQSLKCFLDQPLRLGVERRGGFIEQQDARVFENRPGDGDALPLAA